MTGKIIGNAVSLLILIYIVMLIVFYFMHLGIKSEINDINYNVCETASLKGGISTELFDYLNQSVERFGSFKIRLRYDRYIDSGSYDTFFKNSEILDLPMKMGDRITVYIYSTSRDMFETLLGAVLFNAGADRGEKAPVRSVKSVIITRDGD
jgi:hypothetical protein